MTVGKVALSIPADVLLLAKKQVKSGRAKSLSAFITQAVDEKLQRDELSAILDEMDRELGAPNKKAVLWAQRALKPPTR